MATFSGGETGVSPLCLLKYDINCCQEITVVASWYISEQMITAQILVIGRTVRMGPCYFEKSV